ncbi:amino acid ABC transporter substrate-binding protein, partial [Lactobacillus taiwanensis]
MAMRQSLQSGTIDGYVAADIEYKIYKTVNPNIVAVNLTKMQGFQVDHADSITSIGVKKDDTELLHQVNSLFNGISNTNRDQLLHVAVHEQPQARGKQKEIGIILSLKSKGESPVAKLV